MNNRRTLLFAGTTEGRQLAQRYGQHQLPILICVATEYGKEMLEEDRSVYSKWVEVRVGRLNQEQMESLIRRENPIEVIDATHPYATEVTKQIQQICQRLNYAYLRIHRESMRIKKSDASLQYVNYVENWQQAMEIVNKVEGNCLFTTGSKDLRLMLKDCVHFDQIFARILPSIESIELCQEAGIRKQNIIAMQGPFSKEMNKAIIMEYQICCMVSKEAGHNGGFEEKYRACEELGIALIIIGRPTIEEGMSLEEFFQMRKLNEAVIIQLVGIGVGHKDGITLEGKNAILTADIVFGAKRMVEFCKNLGRQGQMIQEYRGKEIAEYIKQQREQQINQEQSWKKIVVALSGDLGFFSGAKKLKEVFSQDKVTLIPGISVVQALCAKASKSWETMHFISCHGQEVNPIPEIIRHQECFLIFSHPSQVSWLAKQAKYYGLKQLEFVVGINVGNKDEYYARGNSDDFLDFSKEGLCAVIVSNLGINETLPFEENDERFIRGDAPMTKQEIRTLTIGKLQLSTTSVVYDVGTGTGSVGISCAKIAYKGEVYGIEKEEKYQEVLKQNKQLHQVPNFHPIMGEATKMMKELPSPTHAFIGGSSGNMEEILKQLYEKNPQIKIVVNGITIETVAQLTQYAKDTSRKLDIIQVSITKTKQVGSYHMMTGTNPIFIMTLGDMG